jgi:hypothetical protein
MILIVALAAAGWAAPHRPFSHKYHLTLITGCEVCHAAAPASTSASDNLLPQATACVTCHDEVNIKERRKLNVQKFNHAKHLEVGKKIAPAILAAIEAKTYLAAPGDRASYLKTGNPCADCHIGIETSENIDARPEGKAHFPHMADCLVCHDKIDPPKSCKLCHGTETSLKPASHTDDWEDRHAKPAAKIDKTGCAVCHGRTLHCGECH